MEKINDSKLLNYYIKYHGIDRLLDEKSLSKLSIWRLNKGEMLFEQGDTIDSLYMLVKGRIKVSIINDNGDSFVLRYMNRFTILGEVEAFSGDLGQCSVESVAQSDFLKISAEDISDKCFESSKFLKKIIIGLGEKLRTFSSLSYINSLYPVKKRLAIYLLSIFEITGNTSCKTDKKEIEEILGISTRHLNRVISELSEQKIINSENSEIEVLNLEQLRTIAGDERLEF